MNATDLLKKYVPADGDAYAILERHSRLVAEKAVALAARLPNPLDTDFIHQAAMLHDIGACRTEAPQIGCHGDLPYICHGYEGRKILEAEGLPRHALVCERHIGVGLSRLDVRQQGLPLPDRDMVPQSLEERIVAYADLFFSKSPEGRRQERSPDEIRASLAGFGAEKAAIFDEWHTLFSR